MKDKKTLANKKIYKYLNFESIIFRTDKISIGPNFFVQNQNRHIKISVRIKSLKTNNLKENLCSQLILLKTKNIEINSFNDNFYRNMKSSIIDAFLIHSVNKKTYLHLKKRCYYKYFTA